MFRASCAAAVLGLSALSLVPATASAQTSLHAGELEVPIHKSQVVTSDTPIDRALIGNPAIADIVPISDRSVYVLGKGLGTTSLTLYDRNNRVIAVMDVLVGPDIDGLRRELSELLPDETVEARISNGAIVLHGMASDAGAATTAARIAAVYGGENVVNLMSLGGSQQVMLEVRFAEVNRTIGEQLGAGLFAGDNDGDFSAAIGGGASIVPGPNGTSKFKLESVTNAFGVFGALFNIGDLNIEAFLDVLERQGLSRTLAEPTLVALSGERASFLAGGEFPIPVVQGGQGGTSGSGITIEFKSFGVSLGFTPTVLGNGVINLVVEPEVSSIDPASSITLGGNTVPGLQTRRASTTLEMRDGESFAIAGLLRDETRTTVNQLPFFGSLPIIGSLFRSTEYQNGETELLIVVTPRLVRPVRPDQVRLPTDRVADPDVLDVMLNGDVYQPVELPPAAPPAAPADEETGYEF
ncbi:MAG TPA: type II and III secretion system protein family protein [Paracoccaceae bacterium]|nr:type II and III secretion system protein family protein [Paracoccaceae bacterium]